MVLWIPEADRLSSSCVLEPPNARRQPLGIAEARYERTLFPVGCTPLFGADIATGHRPASQGQQLVSSPSRQAPWAVRTCCRVAERGPLRLLAFPWQGRKAVECRHKAHLIKRCPMFEDVINLRGDDTTDEAFGLVGGMPLSQEPLERLTRLRWRLVAELILDDLQNRGGEPGIGLWFFHGASAPLWGVKVAPMSGNSLGATILSWGRLPSQVISLAFPSTPQAPNARGEPRPMAEATQERKLLGVGSTALLGQAYCITRPDPSSLMSLEVRALLYRVSN